MFFEKVIFISLSVRIDNFVLGFWRLNLIPPPIFPIKEEEIIKYHEKKGLWVINGQLSLKSDEDSYLKHFSE